MAFFSAQQIMECKTLLPLQKSIEFQRSCGKKEFKELCDVCNVAINFCECGARCTGCYYEQPKCCCGGRRKRCNTVAQAVSEVKEADEILKNIQTIKDDPKIIRPIHCEDMDIRVRLANKSLAWSKTREAEVRERSERSEK
jgi:hypothetical protein